MSLERRESLVQEGGVDDANDGLSLDSETDGDAEHWEQMGEVDGAIEGIDDPRRPFVDEVITRCAGRICLFAEKAARLSTSHCPRHCKVEDEG